ncbi:MAG TPA: glycosyltransferase family 39 protein [Kofleriaceae bacterium]|nr:glycosyltransferase family 39 protein [Kofleriaceae bacterium]
MPRYARALLLGWIAISFAYLLWHSREPIRFTIGDPWSEANVLTAIKYVKQYGFLETSFTDILDVGPLTADSYRYIHYPPLSEIIYSGIGTYLGVEDIAIYRLFAIAFAGLAMWCLFHYVRRLYDDALALIATALWSSSLFWLMYADSMHQTAILHAAAFLALWGLVRAVETGRRRHLAAAFLGSAACFLTSYDCWLFLPAAVLFTLHKQRGNPFARGNRHLLALCAAGCALGILLKAIFVIGAVGWTELVADIRFQFLERATSTYDSTIAAGLVPTLVRRITLVFSPLFWVAAAAHAIKAIRAPSLRAALDDTAVWLLLVGLAFLRLFTQLAASQMLPSAVLLPFYAIGSAWLIARLLRGRRLARGAATAWLIAAPAWTFWILGHHEREVLDRADVTRVNGYLAAHDHNDYLPTNVMSDGIVQAFFDRHAWPAPDAERLPESHFLMLSTFERTGTTSAHLAIFTTPQSRFIDKSLWPLAAGRRQWSVTGWPHLFPAKTHRLIDEADQRVMANLDALGAVRVMQLTNFDLYRIDRSTLLDRVFARVPVTRSIDLGSLSADRHKLLGWGDPEWMKDRQISVSRIYGHAVCTNAPARPCKTVLTKDNMLVKDTRDMPRAQLMIRALRSCDTAIEIKSETDSTLALSINGFETRQRAPSRGFSVVVPKASITAGVNVITLEDLGPFGRSLTLETTAPRLMAVAISQVEIEPRCEPEPR